MNIKNKKIAKIIISVLIGIILLIVSFFFFIIFAFSTIRTALWILLCLSFVSIILFLILWNAVNRKKEKLLLLIPAICLIIGIIITGHHIKVQKILTVSDEDIYRWNYTPFAKNNSLAKLDNESLFKIDNNLPILDGATALYPVYASFAQAVYPNDLDDYLDKYLMCSRTDGAYENLLQGKADIIFCAQPSQSQMQMFADNSLKLKMIPIGREAFVFFVNSENPVNNLTIDNIKGIYSGKIKNWRKLNGNNKSIKAFQRPENSGSQTMLRKITDYITLEKPRRENVTEGMGGIINQVAVYRNFSNAIGYSFLFYTAEMVKNDKIKLLSIEGVSPTRESIQDNSYPLSDNFYAIYIDNDNKSENTENFIKWILSRQGQYLISETGYTPISDFLPEN
ncbi:MAG: PstS family phosphate ABC transporter substrate-binding protein [Treponema sp.]|nr:PstS family phosphate ABC transporter substrate-binding protein [Treponema sp.]